LSEPFANDQDLYTLPATQQGAMTIYRGGSAVDCGRTTILLPNRDRVVLTVNSEATTTPPVNLCPIADVEQASALVALARPSLPRRALVAPPGALLLLDACTLNIDSALAQVPGLDPKRRHAAFGGWNCLYGADPALADAPYVSIDVQRSGPFDGPTTVIDGRAAAVFPSGPTTVPQCTVDLAQRSFSGIFQTPRIEVLVVTVHTSGSVSPQDQCATASAIAQAAGAALPPPPPS
jgi:hypothetical protein